MNDAHVAPGVELKPIRLDRRSPTDTSGRTADRPTSDRTVRHCLARFAAYGRLRAGLWENGGGTRAAQNSQRWPRYE